MHNQNLHRDSQKRIYEEDYIYFVTTNTYRRFPYFKEEIFCELFIENLGICKELKRFKLYGFTVIPDHIHLLIQPNDEYNISKVMQALKKSFSRDCNNFIGRAHNVGEIHESRLQGKQYSFKKDEYFRIPDYQKYLNNIHQFNGQPKFQWHQSYHDHIIRDEEDLGRHIEYIWYNSEKHGIIDNWQNYKYSSYNNQFQNLIDNLPI